MLSRGRAGCTRSARCRNPRTAPFQPWVGSATQSWPDISGCRSHRRPSSCRSCWRCPRRHLSRFMVQFLSLCGQDHLLAGCRRRLHDAPEWGIVLLNFFVRTAALLNRLRCTAIWLPYKQTKKRRATKRISRRRLRLQEDPTPTSTSPRSATPALTTDSMEAEGV